MTQEAGLVRALLDDPQDHITAQVFADWLEERDDPRAEFLRVQTALAVWEPDLARRTAWQQREAAWLARHGEQRLLGPLGRFVRTWHYAGGVGRVSLSAEQFASRPLNEHGADWLRAAWVRTVQVHCTRGDLAGLLAAPALAGVTSLDLSGANLGDEGVGEFLHSPYLSELRELNLASNGLTETSLRALRTCFSRGHLRRLDLRHNRLDGSALLLYLGNPSNQNLIEVEVAGNPLDRPAWSAFRSWRQDRPGPARLINSIGMEFVRIPAGTFWMGSPAEEGRDNETPCRPVTLTRPFYLGMYPVTQAQYQMIRGRNPAGFSAAPFGGPFHPVENVDWEDASTYCQLLSALPEEQAAGRVYRLPTEAEWEHACRAGTTTPFNTGLTPPTSERFNYDGNHPMDGALPGPSRGSTSPVGLYAPNAFGLFDMHGNVWEWCQDWYEADYYQRGPALDPTGPDDGTRRVIRGGCWACVGWRCRSAHRHGDLPDTRDNYNGFRVALDVPAGESDR